MHQVGEGQVGPEGLRDKHINCSRKQFLDPWFFDGGVGGYKIYLLM